MATVSGTVFRSGSTERVAGATVRASNNGTAVHVLTGEAGDFNFSNLQPGKWSFAAMCEDSFPNTPVTLDVMTDINNLQFKLQRLSGQADQQAGQEFFRWLLYIFGGLVVVYMISHFVFPLKVVGSPISFALWDKVPLRYAEILLWGLAGVLINKIITTSWYLRSQHFYREGTIMHIAHLVATPLLVFVAVLLLSLASFQVTLTQGSQVKIDLNDISILVAVSFLLGTAPWPLWNFIERSAKNVTG